MFWHIDPTIPLLILTKGMGVFFLSSGYHKAFFPQVNDKMRAMFERIGFGWALWLVIGGEFFGGLALILGFLTPVAALGLLAILAGAICLVCWPEVVAKHPRDALDWVAKAIYMPEGLMALVLACIVLTGGAVDHTGFWIGLMSNELVQLLGLLVGVVLVTILIVTFAVENDIKWWRNQKSKEEKRDGDSDITDNPLP